MNIKRIEKGLWWDKNWELLNGCSKVSPACDNCFAENYIHRFKSQEERWQGLTDDNGHWNGVVKLCPEKLDVPLRTKKPTVWFVTERGDLFHEKVPFEFSLRAFAKMKRATQHIFLVLTKRPERALEFCAHWGLIPDPLTGFTGSGEKWPDNIWIGTTAENQEQADKRIPILLQVLGKKFISIEPMLGEIDLTNIRYRKTLYPNGPDGEELKCDININALTGFVDDGWDTWFDNNKIDWVIAGGESGHNARPMHPDWVRSIRDQCQAAGVPFFFKQWGEWSPSLPYTKVGDICISHNGFYDTWRPGQHHVENEHVGLWLRREKAGRLLDGREWNEKPI